jgi:hypothetical protein
MLQLYYYYSITLLQLFCSLHYSFLLLLYSWVPHFLLLLLRTTPTPTRLLPLLRIVTATRTPGCLPNLRYCENEMCNLYIYICIYIYISIPVLLYIYIYRTDITHSTQYHYGGRFEVSDQRPMGSEPWSLGRESWGTYTSPPYP